MHYGKFLLYIIYIMTGPEWDTTLYRQKRLQEIRPSMGTSSYQRAKTIPSMSDLQSAMKSSSRTSLYFSEMIKRVEQHIKENCCFLKHVRASYALETKDSIVFVALKEKPGQINTGLPYTIFVKEINEYSKEGAEMTHIQTFQNPFTKEESEKITKTLRLRSEELLNKHSNIQMISASSVKSKGYGTEYATIIPQKCIVIYTDVKGLIPVKEEPFPTELDGFPVDVREGGVHLFAGRGASEYHETLKMGCQISMDNLSCTLGAFIDDPKTKKVCCITCAHPFLRENLSNGKDIDVTRAQEEHDIFQPTMSPENKFGCFERAIFKHGNGENAGVDIALISITCDSRAPISGDFAEDFPAHWPMRYTSGKIFSPDTLPDIISRRCTLIKCGFQTGMTRGYLSVSGTTVRRKTFDMRYGFTLYNQMEVSPISYTKEDVFAIEGDSGSLVFVEYQDQDKQMELVAAGILVGGTSANTCIVTPISDVLSTLGFPLQLKTFDEQSTRNFSLSPFQNVSPPIQSTASNQASSNIHDLETKIDKKNKDYDQKLDELGKKMDQKFDELGLQIQEIFNRLPKK